MGLLKKALFAVLGISVIICISSCGKVDDNGENNLQNDISKSENMHPVAQTSTPNFSEQQRSKSADDNSVENEQPQQEPENQTQIEPPKQDETMPEQAPTNINNGGGVSNNFDTYDNSAQQQTEAKWVLNTSTMKMHYPTCNQVKKIAPQNYSTSNEDRDILISHGYSMCGVCGK